MRLVLHKVMPAWSQAAQSPSLLMLSSSTAPVPANALETPASSIVHLNADEDGSWSPKVELKLGVNHESPFIENHTYRRRRDFAGYPRFAALIGSDLCPISGWRGALSDVALHLGSQHLW